MLLSLFQLCIHQKLPEGSQVCETGLIMVMSGKEVASAREPFQYEDHRLKGKDSPEMIRLWWFGKSHNINKSAEKCFARNINKWKCICLTVLHAVVYIISVAFIYGGYVYLFTICFSRSELVIFFVQFRGFQKQQKYVNNKRNILISILFLFSEKYAHPNNPHFVCYWNFIKFINL